MEASAAANKRQEMDDENTFSPLGSGTGSWELPVKLYRTVCGIDNADERAQLGKSTQALGTNGYRKLEQFFPLTAEGLKVYESDIRRSITNCNLRMGKLSLFS